MRRPWIKIETCTPDKPEICSLATQLRLDEDAVVGKLVRLWSWAELNGINPNDLGVTKEFLDKLVGRKGFALALAQTGWLIETEGKLCFRNFKRHNSPVAQNKALTAKRVARHRLRKATGKQKITEKPLAQEVQEAPKAEYTAPPIEHAEEVNTAPSSLVISEEATSLVEPETPQNITVSTEPEAEATSAIADPEVTVEELASDEEATTPVEEPTQRKRRAKAATAIIEQPLLF
jgi:hypothetical protein